MNVKYILIPIVLGLFILQQGIAQSSDNINTKNIYDELIDNILEGIDNLEANITDALKTFKDNGNYINNLAQEALVDVEKTVEEVIAKTKATIKKIEDEHENNIGECTLYVDKELDELLKSIILNYQECVEKDSEMVEKALELIEESIKIANNSMNVVNGHKRDLSNCLKSDNVLSCLKKLDYTIKKLQIILPEEIANLVNEISKLISGFEVLLITCAKQQIETASEVTGKIIADVTNCVEIPT